MRPRSGEVDRVISESRALWDAGRWEEALEQLRGAVSAELADEPDVWLELGNSLTYVDAEEAYEAVERATDLADDDPDTLTQCGWAFFHLEEYSKARDVLVRAHAAAPEDGYALVFDGLHLAASLAAKAGDTKRAEEQLRMLVRDHPDDTDFARSLVRLLVEQGRLDEAATELELALDAAGLDERLGAARVDLLVRQLAGGRTREPEDASRSDHPELQALLGQSRELYEAGSITKYAELLEYAMETFPGEVEIVSCAAVAQKDLGNREAALELIRRAIALGPKDPWNLTNLADLLLSVGEIDAADAVTLDAAIYAPVGFERAADILEAAAKVAVARGQTETARTYLEAVLDASPGTGSAALALAELHVAEGEPAEALVVIRRALDAGADDDELPEKLADLEGR